MLRKNYNEDLKKLDYLEKTYQLVKNRAETLRSQFQNNVIDEDTDEGKQLREDLITAEELEEFLIEEIAIFEENKGFQIIRNKNLETKKKIIIDILFDMKDLKDDKLYFYNKYKDDDRLYNLFLNSISIYDKILDVAHFKELLIYLDNGKYIDQVQEAKFKFTILLNFRT
jgi:hypothetical protein